MAKCRACGAPLLWALTVSGKKIPLDPEPYEGTDPRGLFVLRPGPRGEDVAHVDMGTFPGEPRYRSHWATCTDPDRFRE